MSKIYKAKLSTNLQKKLLINLIKNTYYVVICEYNQFCVES